MHGQASGKYKLRMEAKRQPLEQDQVRARPTLVDKASPTQTARARPSSKELRGFHFRLFYCQDRKRVEANVRGNWQSKRSPASLRE